MKNRLSQMAAGLALLAVLGRFYAVPLIAQVRAAIVKNIDEKGRNPYQETALGTCQAGQNRFCSVNFSAIPVGKRLVIEHVSALVNVFSPGVTAQRAILTANSPGNYMAMQSDAFGATLNAPVLLYGEPLFTPPILTISLNGLSNGSEGVLATISGYLVDLSM